MAGIRYLLTHKFLWPLLRGRLLPCFLLSAFVFFTLGFWTYLPQVAFLWVFHRHGAWFNALVLVAGESAAITALIFEAFFVDRALVDVFDAVLVAEKHAALVTSSRSVADSEPGVNTPLTRMTRPTRGVEYSPFSFRQIVELILLLPLNLIPWIGVPLFLWLTGRRAGPLQHHRYFELRAFDKQQKKDFVEAHRLGYTGFGTTQLVLQLVPVLNMFFLMTTAAGSALWAARLENERGSVEQADPSSNGSIDDPPPAYSDAPV